MSEKEKQARELAKEVFKDSYLRNLINDMPPDKLYGYLERRDYIWAGREKRWIQQMRMF